MRFFFFLLGLYSVVGFAQDYEISLDVQTESTNVELELFIENVSGSAGYALFSSSYSLDIDTSVLDLGAAIIVDNGFWSADAAPNIFENPVLSVVQDTILVVQIDADGSQSGSAPSSVRLGNNQKEGLVTISIPLKGCGSSFDIQYVTTNDTRFLWDGLTNGIDVVSQATYDDLSIRTESIDVFEIELGSSFSTPLCYSDTAFFKVNEIVSGSGDYVYDWIFDAGTEALVFENKDTSWVSPSNEGDNWVKVEVTDERLCSSKDSIKVFVNDSISVSLSPDTTVVCPDGDVDISAAYSGGFGTLNYEWISGSNLPFLLEDPTEARVAVNGVSGEVNLKISDDLGCYNVDTAHVLSVNFIVNAFTEHELVCPDYELELTATVTTPIGGDFDYVWFSDNNYFETEVTNDTVVIKPQNSQTYSVRARSSSLFCSFRDSVFVEVQPIVADLGSNPYYVCSDDTISLDGSGSFGTVEYTVGQSHDFNWEFLNVGDGVFVNTSDTLESSIITRGNASLGSSSNVKLTITDSIGCVDSDETTIIWNTEVVANASEDTFYVCLNSTVNGFVSAIGGQGDYSYEWFIDSGNVIITNENTASPIFETNDTAIVVVAATDLVGCVGYDTVRIIGGLDFMVDVSVDDELICPGVMANLDVNAINDFVGGFTYLWDSTGFVSKAPVVAPVSSDFHTVLVTDQRTSCTAKDSIFIEIDDLTAVAGITISTDTFKLCFEEDVVSIGSALTVGGVGSKYYDWSTVDATIELTNDATETVDVTDLTVSRKHLSELVLKVTDDESCESFDTTYVFWNTEIEVDILGNGYSCVNSADSLLSDIQGGEGVYSYSWSTTEGLTVLSRKDSIGTILNADAGETVEKIFLEVQDEIGCSGIDSLDVITKDLQAVLLSDADTTCSGFMVEFEASILSGTAGSNIEYSWDGGVSSTVNSTNSYTVVHDTLVSVLIMDLTSGCEVTEDKTTVVKELDAVIDYDDDLTLCFEDSLLLDASKTNGGSLPMTFNWKSLDEVYHESGEMITVQPEAHDIGMGTRYVLDAEDSKGCVDSDTITVYRNDSISIGFEEIVATCVGATDTIHSVVNGGNSSFVDYEWTILSANTTIPSIYLNRDSVLVSTSDEILTSLRLVVEDGIGCLDTGFFETQSYDLEIDIASDLNNVCTGREIEVYVSSISNQLTDNLIYVWNEQTPTFDSVFTFNITKDTVVEVYAYDDSSSCIRNGQITLSVSDISLNLVPGGLNPICYEDSMLISSSVSNAELPIVYQWSSVDGISGADDEPTLKVQPTIFDTVYYVLNIEDKDGCIATDSVNVIRSTDLVIVFDHNSYSCTSDNDTIVGVVSGGLGEYDYEWSTVSGSIDYDGSQTDSSVVFASLIDGDAQLALSVTDSLGCSSVDTVSTEFITLSSSLTTTGNNTCPDTELLIRASSPNSKSNDLIYSWDGGSVFVSGDSLMISPSFDTVVSVIIYDDSLACKSTSSIDIFIDEVSFDLDDLVLTCFGDSVELEASSATGGSGALSPQWSSNDEDLSSTSGVDTYSIKVLPSASGLIDTTYYLIEVEDELGCSTLDSIGVIRTPELSLSFENNSYSCVDVSDTIIANVSGGVNPITYTWSRIEGVATFTDLGDAIVLLDDTEQLTKVQLEVEDSLGCSIVDTAITESVLLEVSLTSGFTGVCPGTALTVTANVSNLKDASPAFKWEDIYESSNTYDVAPLQDTIVNVVVYDDSLDCYASSSLPIDLNEVSFDLDDLVLTCFGDSVELEASSATGGSGALSPQWSSNDEDLSSTSGVDTYSIKVLPSASGLIDTTYYLIEVEDELGCSTLDSIGVIRTPELSLSFENNSYSCVDVSDTIIANVSGGVNPITYTWSRIEGVATFTDLGDAIVLLDDTEQLTKVQLEVEDSLGCSIVDTAITESVLLEVSLASDYNTVCSGTEVEITANVSNVKDLAPEFKWVDDYVFSNSINVSASVDTTIGVVLYDDSLNCYANSSFVLDIENLSFDLNHDLVLTCNQDSVELIVSNISGGHGVLTSLWQTSYDLSLSADVSASNIKALPVAEGVNDTTYYLMTVEDELGCELIDSIAVVRAAEFLVDIEDDVYLCNADFDTLGSIVSNGLGELTYLWAIDSTGVTILSRTDSVGVILEVSEDDVTSVNLSLLVIDSLGCLATDTNLLSLNGLTIIASADENKICPNTNIIVSVDNVIGNVGVVEYSFDQSIYSSVDEVGYTILNDTTVTISVYDPVSECEGEATVFVDVEEIEVVISGDSLYCYSSLATFDLNQTSGGTGDYSISSTISGAVKVGGDDLNYIFELDSVLSPATFSVHIEDSKGCEGEGAISFIENDSMFVFVGMDDTICSSLAPIEQLGLDQINYGGTQNYDYSWYLADTTLDVILNPTVKEPFIRYDTNLVDYTYHVVLELSDNRFKACSVYDTMDIVISPSPQLNVEDSLIICPNIDYYLKPVEDSLDTYDVIWLDYGITRDSILVDSGSYNVYISNTATSCSESFVIEVAKYNTPNVTAQSDKGYICEDVSLTFDAVLTDTAGTTGIFYWQSSESGYDFESDSSVLTNVVEFSEIETDTVFMIATYIDQCYTYTDSLELLVADAPEVQLELSDSVILVTYEVDYIDNVTNPYPERDLDIEWSIEVDLEELNYSELGTKSMVYLVDGYYTSSLYVEDTLTGCFAVDTVQLEVRDDKLLYVPTVFAPNSTDEDNMTFKVFGAAITDQGFLMRVYNRWGELIYETNSFYDARNNGWDGVHQGTGEEQEIGVYTYTIQGEYLDGEEIEKTGTVTLVR